MCVSTFKMKTKSVWGTYNVLLQIRSSASIGISIYQARDINHTLKLTGARLYIVFIMKTYEHENGAMVKSISISKMHIFSWRSDILRHKKKVSLESWWGDCTIFIRPACYVRLYSLERDVAAEAFPGILIKGGGADFFYRGRGRIYLAAWHVVNHYTYSPVLP